LAHVIPLLTFREKVDPIVQLCHTILAKHGEPGRVPDRTRPGVYRGWYRFPASVEPGSEQDYALKILWTLNIALAAVDMDEARKYAWDAGQLIFDAHVVFKGKKTALHAAFRAGQSHTARALRRRTGANAWQKEVDGRRAGRSKRSAMLMIEQREELKPGTVKKALQRRDARLKKLSSTRRK
jgi:hypothetical protein